MKYILFTLFIVLSSIVVAQDINPTADLFAEAVKAEQVEGQTVIHKLDGGSLYYVDGDTVNFLMTDGSAFSTKIPAGESRILNFNTPMPKVKDQVQFDKVVKDLTKGTKGEKFNAITLVKDKKIVQATPHLAKIVADKGQHWRVRLEAMQLLIDFGKATLVYDICRSVMKDEALTVHSFTYAKAHVVVREARKNSFKIDGGKLVSVGSDTKVAMVAVNKDQIGSRIAWATTLVGIDKNIGDRVFVARKAEDEKEEKKEKEEEKKPAKEEEKIEKEIELPNPNDPNAGDDVKEKEKEKEKEEEVENPKVKKEGGNEIDDADLEDLFGDQDDK